MFITLNPDIQKTLQEDATNRLIQQELLQLPETKIYLVGGVLRNLLLGQPLPYDRDYTIIGSSAIQFASYLADKTDGSFFILDHDHDIARIVYSKTNITLDFSGCMGSTIEMDLGRRDFTMNAIAYLIDAMSDPSQALDLYHGLKSIQQKSITLISEKNILEDPLRMLRAFRFQSELGFSITKETLLTIQTHGSLINHVAKERIGTELVKLFQGTHCYLASQQMLTTGLFEKIIPKIADLRKVPPNQHHNLPLLEHTFEVLRQTELWYKEFPPYALEKLNSPLTQEINSYTAVKLAAIFHDIAKPDTWKIDESGRHSFLTHETLGAEITESILSELAFSKIARHCITTLVKYHLRPFQLSNKGEAPTPKSLYRFFRDLGAETIPLLLLAIADCNAVKGPSITLEDIHKKNNLIFDLLTEYPKSLEETLKRPQLLDGHEIMALLNISPGPLIRQIKKQLAEEQALGKIQTKEQAIEWVQNA